MMKEAAAKPEDFNPNYEERRKKLEPATARPTKPNLRPQPRRSKPHEAPSEPAAPQPDDPAQQDKARLAAE